VRVVGPWRSWERV